jgi:D-glycero-D-manno-heptose 1,7-bisphosphate phosphatase
VKRRGVLLDRDGTLVDFVRDAELGVVTPAFHPAQLRLLPGVLAGLGELVRSGYVLALATNQPGAAKGELSREAIEATTSALVERLGLAGIEIAATRICLHHPTGGDGGEASLVKTCGCRKPEPGMFLELLSELALDPASSWVVGDTPTDVLAAERAGLRSALVAPLGRCELCPMRALPDYGAHPMLHRPRFDELVRAMLELDATTP